MKKLTALLALVLSVLLPALAVAEEAEPTPAPVPAEAIMAYTQVYEPETSFALSSTVAWNADASVLEVAGTFGYNNGSKFAKAFRDVCGVSPNEYRQSADK